MASIREEWADRRSDQPPPEPAAAPRAAEGLSTCGTGPCKRCRFCRHAEAERPVPAWQERRAA